MSHPLVSDVSLSARRVALGVCGFVGGLLAGASSAEAAITGPVAVPGSVVQLAGQPDGSLRVATILTDTSSDPFVSTPSLRTITPDGRLVPVASPPPTAAITTDASIALTADGGAIATYAIRPTPRAATSVVAARTFAADGAAGPETIISTPGKSARAPGSVVVGPSGAAAITFTERSDAESVPRLAYRVPGAAAFAPSVPLDRASRSRSYSIVLGPDGGGVVVSAPSGFGKGQIRLRRITAAGTLGPWLPVPIGNFEEPLIAAAFTGSTVVLGVATTDEGQTIRSRLLTTSLRASASRFSKVQRLQTAPNQVASDGLLDLVPTTTRRVALLTKGRGRGLQLFEGPAGALRASQRLLVSGPEFGHLLAQPGGGLTAYWLGSVTKSTDVRLLSARRAPGASRFETPQLVPGFPANPNAGWFGGDALSLSAPALLADGRTAIAYNPSHDDIEAPQPDAVILTTG